MSTKNIFNLVLLAALWGASFLFMRIAVPEFGAVLLIELRVLIAGLVLLPFWWSKEAESSKSKLNALHNWRNGRYFKWHCTNMDRRSGVVMLGPKIIKVGYFGIAYRFHWRLSFGV